MLEEESISGSVVGPSAPGPDDPCVRGLQRSTRARSQASLSFSLVERGVVAPGALSLYPSPALGRYALSFRSPAFITRAPLEKCSFSLSLSLSISLSLFSPVRISLARHSPSSSGVRV